MGAPAGEGGFSTASSSLSSSLSEESGDSDLKERRLIVLFLEVDLVALDLVVGVVEGLEAGRGGLKAGALRFSGGIF